MPVATFLKLTHLLYFSKPASDRLIYQVIRRQKVHSILECGIGVTQRAIRMIQLARLVSPEGELHYTGMDLFEGREASDGPGVSLKRAHQLLTPMEAKIRLIPGDPASMLAAMASPIRYGTGLRPRARVASTKMGVMARQTMSLARSAESAAAAAMTRASSPAGPAEAAMSARLTAV